MWDNVTGIVGVFLGFNARPKRGVKKGFWSMVPFKPLTKSSASFFQTPTWLKRHACALLIPLRPGNLEYYSIFYILNTIAKPLIHINDHNALWSLLLKMVPQLWEIGDGLVALGTWAHASLHWSMKPQRCIKWRQQLISGIDGWLPLLYVAFKALSLDQGGGQLDLRSSTSEEKNRTLEGMSPCM